MLLERIRGNIRYDTRGFVETGEVRMIYASGETVELGDTVYLGGDQSGIIVGIIDDCRYADGYRKEDWMYLDSGLILSTNFGDLRLDEPDEDLELVARSPKRMQHSL